MSYFCPPHDYMLTMQFRHYMPATTKVLSIIDKGVQDRVTKNGECLRRHADSMQRWKLLKERISRTDADMESVRKILLGGEVTPSESGSTTSGPTSKSKSRNGYLTPPNSNAAGKKSRGMSASSALSRSVSPFRKFARKLTGAGKSPAVVATPVPPAKQNPRTPSSEPVGTLRHRSSIFAFAGSQPPTPSTPERPGHKYSQSVTPESSPGSRRLDQRMDLNTTIKGRSPAPSKLPWNASTKIEPEERPAQARRPSNVGMYSRPDIPLSPGGSPYKRSLSRSSMASSRPWSPVTSSVSTAPSSNTPVPFQRPPSRTQYQTFQRPPSRSQTPSTANTLRSGPKTPSHIPTPNRGHYRSPSGNHSEAGWDDDENPTTLMQRAFSPTNTAMSSPPRSETPGGTRLPGPRPQSRSMIPAPTFYFSSPSRPGSAMSDYRPESPTQSTASSFRSSAIRAQTPEALLRSRAQQVPFYQGHQQSPSQSQSSSSQNSAPVVKTARPSLGHKVPPSSFRDGNASRAPSRPSSRAGAATPSGDGAPAFLYTPGNQKDPLDVEVAAIVNGIAHGLFIERVDPPLRAVPKEGEEVRAQYAFSNSLARKTVTCRLTTLSRAGAKGEPSTASKKVMVRVGGGESRFLSLLCDWTRVDLWRRMAGFATVHTQPSSRYVIRERCAID